MQRTIAITALGLGLLLAGCSQSTQTAGTTGAVAPGQTAPATGTATTDASSASVLPQVDKKSCEELKVELASFQEAKIPQKLAQFAESKYTPTAEELPRFQRYVQVNQNMKTRCAAMQAEKPAETTKKKKKKTKVEQAPVTPEAPVTDSSG